MKKKLYKNIALLLVLVSLGIFEAKSQTKSSNQKTEQESTPRTKANQNPADANENQRPVVILALDISISIQPAINSLRSVAKQAIMTVPENSVFGIVTIGTQSEKKIPLTREEALSYINSIEANAKYTDLERGTDAVLAALQSAPSSKSAFILYLTDGDVSLPKELKIKHDFKTILIREFTNRPEIRVFVLNVAEKIIDKEGLPPNVDFIPAANWQEAEKQMQESLAPRIQQELPVSPTNPVSQNNESNTAPIQDKAIDFHKTIALVLLLCAVSGAVGILVIRRRRKKATQDFNVFEENQLVFGELPTDLMHEEDLLLSNGKKQNSLPVALFEFYDGKQTHFEKLMPGERLILGNSRTSDIAFEMLRQANTLEFRFDKGQVSGYRLRSQTNLLDDVRLNDKPAPIKFTFHPANTLKIENLEVKIKLIDESIAEIFTTQNSTVTKWNSRLKHKQNEKISEGDQLQEKVVNILDENSIHNQSKRKSRWN